MQYSTLGTPGLIDFVESADPIDLERRIAAKVDELRLSLAPAASNFYLLDIAGGGDGHTFIATVGVTTAANAPTGIGGPFFACYMAATARELPAARANAVRRFPFFAGVTRDELLAGASQGTKFMGVMLMGEPVG